MHWFLLRTELWRFNDETSINFWHDDHKFVLVFMFWWPYLDSCVEMDPYSSILTPSDEKIVEFKALINKNTQSLQMCWP